MSTRTVPIRVQVEQWRDHTHPTEGEWTNVPGPDDGGLNTIITAGERRVEVQADGSGWISVLVFEPGDQVGIEVYTTPG